MEPFHWLSNFADYYESVANRITPLRYVSRSSIPSI